MKLMKKPSQIFFSLLIPFSMVIIISCSAADGVNNDETQSTKISSEGIDESDISGFKIEGNIIDISTKIIQSFEFLASNNSKYLSDDIKGTISGNTITLRLPVYTNKTSLIPTITFSGESISPNSNKPVNFFNGDVTYVVTAEDGSSINYEIIVKRQQLVRTVEYMPLDKQNIDTDTDEIIGYSVPEFYTNGKWSKYSEFYSSGTDCIWFNEDDDIYLTNAYNKKGEIAETYSFNNSGPDGLYHTQDDVYNSYKIYFYDKKGNIVENINANSPGTDGIWLTNDDGFSLLQLFEYENNLLTKEVDYSDINAISCYYLFHYNQDSKIDTEWKYEGSGNDNTWFTDDDELTSETSYMYDESGNVLRETVGHDKFGDVSYWFSYAYNSKNKIIEKVEFKKEGYDNVWFTDDDVINSKEMYEYNKDGQVTLSINSHSSGVDNVWYNADDDIDSYSVLESTNSTDTYSYYYWPDNRIGPDNLWFTEDDIPWYKIFIRYNIINNVKKDQEIYICSYGAGKDGIWFTKDDEKLNSYMRNRFDGHGNPLGTTYYNGAGEDGIWLTDDDIIDYYTVCVYK